MLMKKTYSINKEVFEKNDIKKEKESMPEWFPI